MVKYQSPVNDSWVNHRGHPNGDALDLGWFTSRPETKSQPIYAIEDGVVIYVGYVSDGGSTIVIAHKYNDTHDMWAGYMHLSKQDVVKGQVVKKGQKIGNMGETGAPGKPHLHVRMSILKKGLAFSWNNFNSVNRENPSDWLYAYPHQYVEDMQKYEEEKEPTKPSEPTFKSYSHTIPAGSTLYRADGTAYPSKTTNAHKVTIIAEKGDLGNFKASWLVGVDNAWTKIKKTENKPKPTPKPSFKAYDYTIPKGTTLYNANGKAYPSKTTRAHKVRITKESNGLGNFSASWLVGVSNAWVKVGNAKPVFKPYKKTIPRGATLYRKDGTAYPSKTTRVHTVTIIAEHNGLGNFKASWLVGVDNAWVKVV